MRKTGALALLVLLIALQASYTSGAPPTAKGRLHVLDAKRISGVIVFAGYIERGYVEVPVAGYIKSGEARVYVLGPYGVATRVKRINESLAVAVGSTWRHGGMAAVYALIGPGLSPRVFLVAARGAELYGGDAILKNGSLIVAATLVKSSAGVNTSAVTRESDCLVASIRAGRVERVEVFGSREFDDYPSVLLENGGSLIVVGETWSHEVAQSAVFVVRLGRGLRLESSWAYDTSGEDTVSDAKIVGGGVVVAGSTGGEKSQALIVVDRGDEWEAYTSAFTGDGHADRIYVSGGHVVFLGTGGLGEKALKYMYSASLNGGFTVYSCKGHVLFPLDGGARPLSITGGGAIIDGGRAFCLSQSCGESLEIKVLDASGYWAKYWRRAADVRRINPLFVEKEPVEIYVEEAAPQSYPISVSSIPVAWSSGVYEEKVDWGYRVQVFLNRNLPALMVIVPMALAALAVWIAARRRV